MHIVVVLGPMFLLTAREYCNIVGIFALLADLSHKLFSLEPRVKVGGLIVFVDEYTHLALNKHAMASEHMEKQYSLLCLPEE